MKKARHFYLVHIQYLGFRYHGWQKQPGVKTIEFMIEKTLDFILKGHPFNILGASRTDARVSASHTAFELFIDQDLDKDWLLRELNLNLPNDIRVLRIETVDNNFSIINSPKIKEYVYLFSFGEQCHPFCASLMGFFPYNLDIDLMKQGADLFKGQHNFRVYCTKPAPHTQFKRTINVSMIEENTVFSASFFPDQTWAYHIHSKGFMRNQVRLIMGQLLSLGRKEISLDDIKVSLTGNSDQPLRHIAPSSGLILNNIQFK